jgi:hypothetical protein
MSARAGRHVHACAVAEGTRAVAFVCDRRLCLECGERRPRFRHRGVVKCDPDHTLCFRCYRAVTQRARAVRLSRGEWFALCAPHAATRSRAA